MHFDINRRHIRARAGDLEFTWHRFWSGWLQWRFARTYVWLGPLTIRRCLP